MKPIHRSKRRLRSWIYPLLPAAALVAMPGARASVPKNPELQTLEIAKHLKPIPNAEWKKIAGDKLTEKYAIVKGDNLYDISERLFGDPKYWPKIWALNNGTITNPHLIYPGNKIDFLPGTGTSLPTLAIETADSGLVKSDLQTGVFPRRSQEWKYLPKQSWETVDLALPPQIDPLGFDSRSRIKSHAVTTYDLPILAASAKIQPFGLIFGGDKEANIISLGDLVFIHSEGDLQIGQTYSITQKPERLSNALTDRRGYAYTLLGKVKILQEREGAYVGLITNAMAPIYRGSLLIPLQARIPNMAPIPGPNSIEGEILLNPASSANATAQNHFVYIDRGSDDGVSPGMVFRSYERIDPNNGKLMTKTNAIITADTMVVQTSAKFSTGIVLSSYTYLSEGANAVLLTDVSDLLKRHSPGHLRLQSIGTIPPDALDELDNGQGLTDAEKRELKQLEKWKQNPSSESNSTEELPPPTAPTPDIPPPPGATPAVTPTPPSTSDEEIPPPPSSSGSELPAPPSENALPPESSGSNTPDLVPPPPPPPASDSAASSSDNSGSDIPPPPPPPGS